MAKQAQIDAVRPALDAADKAVTKAEKVLDAVDKATDKGTDVIESGLEKVADVVPDALDTAVHVSTEGGRKAARFFRNPKHLAIALVIATTTAGAALGVAGYFAMKKQLELKLRKEYDDELESQIAEIRRFYATREVKEGYTTPAEAVEALIPAEAAAALTSYRGLGGEPKGTAVLKGAPAVISGETAEEVTEGVAETVDLEVLRERMKSGTPVEITETANHNIFVEGNPLSDLDYQAELAKRSPDEPYVISHSEYMENENGFTQQDLTYYNGDDILTDDQDTPITDIEFVVGSESLTRFGQGSGDRNVVYVCNEKTESIYEITMSSGEFGKEVAGFQHSAPIRRFRQGRDE